MKKAIFTTTNGYDLIILENGTLLEVTEENLLHFLNAESEIDDFSNWNGENYWTDYANTIDEAVATGQEILAYYENGKLIIVDNEKLIERMYFYSIG